MSKKIISLIPDSIKSPINRVLFDNIFQKYFNPKKQNNTTISVGLNRDDFKISQTLNIDSNISQYQPVVTYNDKNYSFYDLLSLLQQHEYNIGFDTDFHNNGLDVWGSCNIKSLKLPINMDKFVHYADYCWIGDTTPSYVVIRNGFVQQKEIEINNARLLNDNALVAILQSEITNDINSTDPDGLFDHPTIGFDNYNFDSNSTGSTSITGTNWESNNRWVHKDDLEVGAQYQVATMPIIEYSNQLELVKWIKINHNWKYRSSPTADWIVVSEKPSIDEIESGQREFITVYSYNKVNNNEKKVFFEPGSIPLVNGSKIILKGSDYRWTVNSSIQLDGSGLSYVTIAEDNFRYFRFDDSKQLVILEEYDVIDVSVVGINTTVTVRGDLSSFISPTGSFSVLNFFNEFAQKFDYLSFAISSGNTVFTLDPLSIIPTNDLNGRASTMYQTSKNDEWSGFFNQWCYNGIIDSTVTEDQIENTGTTITINKNTLNEVVDVIEIGTYVPKSHLLIHLSINNVPVYNFEFGNFNGVTFSETIDDYGLINSIKLNESITVTVPLKITINIAAQSTVDVGKENKLVRTNTEIKSINNVTLIEYQHINQSQTKFNLYPLFKQYTLSTSPILMDEGTHIFKHKIDNTGIYVRELHKSIAVNNNNELLFDVDICKNNIHTMYKIAGEYKHLWSNTSPSTITLDKVDSNGFSVSSSFYNNSIQQYPAIPKYLYGNINNKTFSVVSRNVLSSHFDTILSLNNSPRRILPDINYIDNTESKLNIFDSVFPYVTNIITNDKSIDLVIEAHKQLRLSYLSIFLTNSLYDVDANSITNISAWYLKIKEQLLKFDSLKINDNQLNHPLTPSMISKSFLTQPCVIDNFILSHDGILIKFDLLYGLFVNKMKQQPQYMLSVPSSPTVNQVYYDNENFYIYNGSSWNSFSMQQKVLDLMLLLENELYDISNTINSPVLNPILNNTHFEDIQQNLYLSFANNIGNKYPYSNRTEYDLSNSFTWNYLSIINLVDVNSPLVSTPIITNSLWGISYKEIYNNLFGTPYPNIEPWKLQGYLTKPLWWDGNYKDFSFTRLWNSTMWANILNGVVPSGELLPNGITISNGSSGSCTQYVFVPVNTTSSVISGIQPDELLPPFRSTLDALSNSVLINNINLLNISLTNNAEDSYGYGSLSEWNWKEQITYSYDLLLCYFKNDPRNLFKRRNTVLVDGVEFKNNGLINQEILRDKNVNFVYELYKKYGNFYNKLIDLSEFNLIKSSMAILPGTYINKDVVHIKEITTDLIDIESKLNQFNIIKPVTNFKISIQNIDNTKRSDLLHNCSFSIDSIISHIPSVNVFKSLYSKATLLSDTTATIDPTVYANLVSGAKIIVTWDGYVPEEFIEQNDFYVIKRGSNIISLCRSITEIETTNYITLPQQYPYDIYIGVLSKQFNVLQRQTVQQDFNLYSLIYNQSETIHLPHIVNGIQELINFLNGYMLKLNNDGIFETYFLNQTTNDTYNRIENFQLSMEILLSDIYNDKTNRVLFFGNDYYCNIFKNTIHVNTDKQLLSLVHDEQQRDLSLLYDENDDNIPTSNIIVFRTNPILIETANRIGGAILYLATSQDIIILNNSTFTLEDKNYPETISLTSGMLSSTDGFIDINNTYEYNFEELTNSFKNIFTLDKTTPLFKTLSQQQLGYQPFSNNSLYGLSDDGGFKLWRESLSQKGSYENLIPFETGFNQSITSNPLVNSYLFSFGDDFLYDYKQIDFQRKRYLLQNSQYSFNSLSTQIQNDYTDTFVLNRNLNINTLSNDNVFEVNNGNAYVLKISLNIEDSIIKFSIPRFSSSVMSYSIIVNTDISKVEVFVNDIKTDFSYIKNTYNFTITCNIDDQITNNIIIVLPTTTIIEKYSHIDPFHIMFDMENILLTTTINTSFYIRDINTPRVLLTETTKTALKKFEVIDTSRNLVPYVDFVDLSDPMLLLYNIVDNQPVSNQSTRCLQFINKTWYKSSILYKPYNNLFFNEDFRVRNYNKSYLDDDGVYQLIDTDIPPNTWHDIADTNVGNLINGIPLHKIQTRTRLSENSPWDPWITKNIEHQRVITNNIIENINLVIGNQNDVLQIFVNGEFQQLEFFVNTLTITIGQPLSTNVIDIFIIPIKKDNEDLIEYEYLYNYYEYTQGGVTRYVYWVKNYKDSNAQNAFIFNNEIKDNNTNMFGVINNNIIVFNKDYRWQQPHVLLHNNKVTFDMWSQHTISTNATKMSRLLWDKIIFSAYSQNRDVTKASKEGIWIIWTELVDQINSLLINNIDLLTPYGIEDVILNNNSSYDKLNALYDMLSSQIINIIIYSITKHLSFDVSDYIIFSSMCEFIAVETV